MMSEASSPPKRRAFYVMLAIVVGGLITMIWAEGQTRERYDGASCQYHLAFGQTIDAGIYSVGGSVMMTATDADDFNAHLEQAYPGSATAIDAGHSYFSIEKELILIRDFLETHSPRSFLVMIRGRKRARSTIHDDFLALARLSDIPLAMQAIGAAHPLNALDIPSKILRHRLVSVFDESDVGRKIFKDPTTDCHGTDYRLNLEQLARSQQGLMGEDAEEPQWNLAAPRERINLTYITALKEIADEADVPLIMLYLPHARRPLPDADFADQFEAQTGVPLIIPDAAMQDRLNADGRRDMGHINEAGRAYFLPWLTEQVVARCPEGKTCL